MRPARHLRALTRDAWRRWRYRGQRRRPGRPWLEFALIIAGGFLVGLLAAALTVLLT